MKKKTCQLDPAPTFLVSQSFKTLKSFFTHVINSVIEEAHFPDLLKHAQVTPKVKDNNKSNDDLANLRPISRLPFLAKLIEKVIHLQTEDFIDTNQLHAKFQSAYRAQNSCETASIRIFADIQKLVFEKSHVALIALDSSSAFDTVDHEVLLRKLRDEFGIEDKALALIKSYVENRTFSVEIEDKISTKRRLECGVPQGSILGPLIYILYTKGIQSIVESHKINIHMYADDCQLYLAFKSENQITAQENANNCLSKIKIWMDTNYLKLNTNKTTLKLFSPDKIQLPFQINYNNDIIKPSNLINILGIKVKKDIDFSPFISKKVQTCYMHLRNLFHIRNSLTFNARVQMVTNLILSNLDYCNSILICSTKKAIRPLQLVLNRAIRFIFYLKRDTHITPFLKKLHILPIIQRIKYKTCLISYKIFYNLAPLYLLEKFPTFRPSTPMNLRMGRGRDNFMFEQELSKRDTIYSEIKSQWNKLPIQLRMITNLNIFKGNLKKHFFLEAFN